MNIFEFLLLDCGNPGTKVVPKKNNLIPKCAGNERLFLAPFFFRVRCVNISMEAELHTTPASLLFKMRTRAHVKIQEKSSWVTTRVTQ